jgi:hypothetical protein
MGPATPQRVEYGTWRNVTREVNGTTEVRCLETYEKQHDESGLRDTSFEANCKGPCYKPSTIYDAKRTDWVCNLTDWSTIISSDVYHANFTLFEWVRPDWQYCLWTLERNITRGDTTLHTVEHGYNYVERMERVNATCSYTQFIGNSEFNFSWNKETHPQSGSVVGGTEVNRSLSGYSVAASDYKCVQSCTDKGHWFRVRWLSTESPWYYGAAGYVLQCAGQNSSSCSWFLDRYCTILAPNEQAPVSNPREPNNFLGHTCEKRIVESWCAGPGCTAVSPLGWCEAAYRAFNPSSFGLPSKCDAKPYSLSNYVCIKGDPGWRHQDVWILAMLDQVISCAGVIACIQYNDAECHITTSAQVAPNADVVCCVPPFTTGWCLDAYNNLAYGTKPVALPTHQTSPVQATTVQTTTAESSSAASYSSPTPTQEPPKVFQPTSSSTLLTNPSVFLLALLGMFG